MVKSLASSIDNKNRAGLDFIVFYYYSITVCSVGSLSYYSPRNDDRSESHRRRQFLKILFLENESDLCCCRRRSGFGNVHRRIYGSSKFVQGLYGLAVPIYLNHRQIVLLEGNAYRSFVFDCYRTHKSQRILNRRFCKFVVRKQYSFTRSIDRPIVRMDGWNKRKNKKHRGVRDQEQSTSRDSTLPGTHSSIDRTTDKVRFRFLALATSDDTHKRAHTQTHVAQILLTYRLLPRFCSSYDLSSWQRQNKVRFLGFRRCRPRAPPSTPNLVRS